MDTPLTEPLVDWFADQARDLPWRHPGIPAWHVLVSEVMLQQTPVARVLPVYPAWLDRWPTPAALAASPSGEAVRMWGKLGYPRRALRLHACAVAITAEFDGEVPSDLESLLGLPGRRRVHRAGGLAFAFAGGLRSSTSTSAGCWPGWSTGPANADRRRPGAIWLRWRRCCRPATTSPPASVPR